MCQLANFHQFPEILVLYDEFRSYFSNKCELRETGPGFQRGAVFIYAYQVVTSESDSKVRLLSPVSQQLQFDQAGALRLR